MNFLKHIKMNLYFYIKLMRDAIMVLFVPHRLYRRYEYNGKLFLQGSSLEIEFDKFRSEVRSALGSNYFTISYKEYSRHNLIKHFVLGSQFVQMLRWYRATNFLRSYEDSSLEKFYNGQIGRSYCGILKLNNIDWLRSRIIQFAFIQKFFENKEISYIEVGGSSGVLPLFAAYLGYDHVVNSDYNNYDVLLSKGVAENLGLGNFAVVKDVIDPDLRERFDIVSCHQVIEHTPNPDSFLAMLKSLMSANGLLILSHGYHLPIYPGHIPIYSEQELEESFTKVGLHVVARSEGNTYYLQKAESC